MKTKTSILPSRLLSNSADLHPAVNPARTRREIHPPSNPHPGRWLTCIGLLLALTGDTSRAGTETFIPSDVGSYPAGVTNATAGGGGDQVVIAYAFPAQTYTWAATNGTADWTAAASWSPDRNAPATKDVLQFTQGGTPIATNVPTQTLGRLQVSGGTSLQLKAGGSTTLSLSEIGGEALSVDAGSQLNVNGTNSLTLHILTGANGGIRGTLTFSATASTAHALTAADAGGITFHTGSIFIQGTNASGNAFGTSGTTGTVIFAAGSTFQQQGGGNPFSLSAPSSKVVFQTGSLFSLQQNANPSASGRTYANFEHNINATNSASGNSPLTVSNLSVVRGTWNIANAGGLNLGGNISVAAGAALWLNCLATNSGGKTITIDGGLGGSGTNAGPATGLISATGTLAPGTGTTFGTLTFATTPTLNGRVLMKINRNGGTPLADKIILSSSSLLTYGGALIVTNLGTALQAGDTFTLFSAPAFDTRPFTSLQLPALTNGLAWNTGPLNVSGQISVFADSAPSLSASAVPGGTLRLDSIHGVTNGTVTVLSSTNLRLTLAQWQVVTNGSFDGTGHFSCTVSNAVESGVPTQFYILKTP